MKKELKRYFTKRQNKISKQINYIYEITTISSIIIGLLLIRNITYLENQNEVKQLKNINECGNNSIYYSIVPLLLFSLNDNKIICDVGSGCEYESIDQGRSYIDKNINISNCFFSRISLYNGDGGVINVNGGSYSMNVNNSMFYNCIANNYGAIYFYSTNSYLRMICANRCSASWFHFVYLKTSQMNQFEYISVSKCTESNPGYYSFGLSLGNQNVDYTNSSMNNAFWGSGIYTWSPSSYNSSYCTFSNNKVSDKYCICLGSTSGIIYMSYANIVYNNSPSHGVVYVWGSGSRKMMYCIFHNNQNNLFFVESGSLEVSHSFISHSGSFSISTAVSTSINNSFTNIITYQLQFYNSHYCNTDILLPQRTIVESPIRSLQETIGRTNEETSKMTFERTIDQTIRETLINTIDQTIRETPKETIPRTYAECIFTIKMPNLREISVIFNFLYPVIILMIL